MAPEGSNLTISSGHNNGRLTVKGGKNTMITDYYCGAGIGCGAGSRHCGNITINSGIITAVGGDNEYGSAIGDAAGIGGASCSTSANGGIITINGSTVTAEGGTGIGGSNFSGTGKNNTINIINGTVNPKVSETGLLRALSLQ
jgi:hypothetical protein